MQASFFRRLIRFWWPDEVFCILLYSSLSLLVFNFFFKFYLFIFVVFVSLSRSVLNWLVGVILQHCGGETFRGARTRLTPKRFSGRGAKCQRALTRYTPYTIHMYICIVTHYNTIDISIYVGEHFHANHRDDWFAHQPPHLFVFFFVFKHFPTSLAFLLYYFRPRGAKNASRLR